MKSLGIFERIDDALNPIVVKELRQAVQSRFVVAVLLLFLLIQLVFMGIYLVASGISGRLDSSEFQAGRTVFSVIQGIMLATCLLFIPLYTAFRLAAERSQTNVDLLFISTLRPRSIVFGKFVAAVVLAILIFSACTPFMTFTYFLRGIDLPTIFFVLAIDFIAVLGAVMLSIFVAVVPANLVLKVLLGLFGLFWLLNIFYLTLAGTVMLTQDGLAMLVESRYFWVTVAGIGLAILGLMGLLFTWSVALLSPPSANRALPMRLWVTLLVLASGGIMAYCNRVVVIDADGAFLGWMAVTVALLCLCLFIAINEREKWGPRVARNIPRNLLLRPFAFLYYSGAAGGIIWSVMLFGLTGLAVYVWRQSYPAAGRIRYGSGGMDPTKLPFEIMAIIFLYVYCYGLTAVFVRRFFLRIPAAYTWVVMIFLMALGSALPYLLTFLLHQRDFRFQTHYYWLATNPGAAAFGVGETHFLNRYFFFVFAGAWAGTMTLLNVPWFIRQMVRFRPYVASRVAAIPEVIPVVLPVTAVSGSKTV